MTLPVRPRVASDQGGLRSDKLRVTASVARISRTREIRTLAAGGVVFAFLGLISPRLSRSVTAIVEPTKLVQLVLELEAEGWVMVPAGTLTAVLPPIFLRLRHDDHECTLDLYDMFPGFYASQAVVFDAFWNARAEFAIGGEPVPSVDRAATMVLAAHDGLGPLAGNRRAPSNFDYFVTLYRRQLTAADRDAVVALIVTVGGIAPLRLFLEAVGIDAGATVLPSMSYARARLYLEHVSDPVLLALALLEASLGRRRGGISLVMRRHPGRALVAVLLAPISFVVIAGAHRRRGRLGSRPMES